MADATPQEVPRANKLYMRVMVSWVGIGFFTAIAGVVLMFVNNQNFPKPVLYTIIAFGILAGVLSYAPEATQEKLVKARSAISFIVVAALFVFFLTEPSLALALFIGGMACMSFPDSWRKSMVKGALARFGHEVLPLNK